MNIPFPRDFLWGAASSAYQVEGWATADGGGPSVWDTFTHTPGKIADGWNGDVACDSYHRWAEDVALLRELGADSYRFSASWARIDPQADGRWNEAGIAYYERLVDALLAAGIEPAVTLYHWELPQAAEDRGGWTVCGTAEAFARYAGMMAARFRGRVRIWYTLNEPQCTVGISYGDGVHAPGRKLDAAGQFRVLVNQQLAHGLAQRAIKAADPHAVVAIASTGRACYPLEETPEDIAAARAACFSTNGGDWAFTHHWLLDPICFGRYPHCAGTAAEPLAASVTPEELETMHAVPDALGINIYNAHAVRAVDGGVELAGRWPGFPRTAIGWPVTPEALDWGVRILYERYRLPFYISENGVACADVVSLDGQVHDPGRIDFLERYLLALRRALDAGVDLRGYYYWALTDNFEWSRGFDARFGLAYVDFRTCERLKKDSFHWMQGQIARCKRG